MHQVETVVDLLELKRVHDQISDVDLLFHSRSTIFGMSVQPLAPPKAVTFHTRPVTSWRGRGAMFEPAGATLMITDNAPVPAAGF